MNAESTATDRLITEYVDVLLEFGIHSSQAERFYNEHRIVNTRFAHLAPTMKALVDGLQSEVEASDRPTCLN